MSLAGEQNAFVAMLNAAGSALVYSTYLGGSNGESGNGIAVNSSGNAYITGVTISSDFPTVNPLQGSLRGSSDAFVAKLDPTGSTLVYSTYLGGSGGDDGRGIAVDPVGNAYITGGTGSIDFPTVNPIQGSLGGNGDAFVAKLDPTGSTLVYSTYLGGSGGDGGRGIAVDSAGNAYVTGETGSTNFPTANPLQGSLGGNGAYVYNAFVAKLNPAGSALVYSTYLGGSGPDLGYGVAADYSGNAYVVGQTMSANFPTANSLQASLGSYLGNAFVAKLNPEGSALVYSTYLGGSIGYTVNGVTVMPSDSSNGIAVDSSGDAYVVGSTSSANFPTANPLQASLAGEQNAFVAELNPTGSALVYSTYLGGWFDYGNAIAVDSSGNAYVSGQTGPNFPVTPGAFQTSLGGVAGAAPPSNAFLAKISPSSPPLVTFSSTSIAFGNQTLGTTSSAQNVTLTNTGPGSLTIASIVVSGDFVLAATQTPCPYTRGTVAPGVACMVDVTFTPTATGPLTGSVTISDNNNGVPGSTQTVSLTGTGTAPVAGVSPGSLTFSGQTVGASSASQTVTLSNTGTAALTLSSIGIGGDFAQTNNCGGSVAASGSCIIKVTFTPKATGPLTGSVTITDNSNGVAGSTQTVRLSGTGEDFTLATPSGSSSSQTASPGQTATYTLSVGGEGGFNQSVALTCTGAPSESTCAVSPNPVTVGSSATNVTVTVTTAAPSVSAPRTLPPLQPRLPGPKALLILAVLLAGVAWTIRGWRQIGASWRQAVLVPLAAGLLLALALAGCGGGGGGGGTTNPGTPAGTYTLTVTGTAGSSSTALSHSTTLTLNVS